MSVHGPHEYCDCPNPRPGRPWHCAASVVRVCDGSCDCSIGICNEPADAWCDHCPVHCTCPEHKQVEG